MTGRVQAPTATLQAPPSNLALCEVGDVRVPITQQNIPLICLALRQFRALMLPERRCRMRKPRDNSDALAAFIAKKVGTDTVLARLIALSADHLSCAPDAVNWSDVGTFGCYLDR